jgi:hypothetical protein
VRRTIYHSVEFHMKALALFRCRFWAWLGLGQMLPLQATTCVALGLGALSLIPFGCGLSITLIITAQPANVTVQAGRPAIFQVTAARGAPLSYQWLKNGSPIAATNESSYTTPPTIGSDNGSMFSVVVLDPEGSVTSTKALLTVTPAPPVTVGVPVIVVQPASVHVCATGSTSLSVTAQYAGTYQWYFNGVPIFAATSASYSIAPVASTNAGSYTVTIANAAGSVLSNAVQVVVGSSIVSNPANLTVNTTQTALFSVSAVGSAPFSYQWYEASGSGKADAIAGATFSTYTTPPATASLNAENLYVTVNDACGTLLTSTMATLTVEGGTAPPTIVTNPQSQIVPAGETTSLTVVASGTPALSYQWYVVRAGKATGSDIAGATSTTYTVPSTETAAGNNLDAYYVIVTNAYGLATSSQATLGIGNGILLSITKEPANVYVGVGNAGAFSVSAMSQLPLSYQWYKALPGTSTFNQIPGATNPALAITSAAVSDTGSVFYVVVSNGSSAPVTSTSASLFVGALPIIGGFCAGWEALGDAIPLSGCSFQLTDAVNNQHGEIVWHELISTDNIQLSFTLTTDKASAPPADGFTMMLGDPSLGATPTSLGAVGKGLGAEGIPGFVLAFDDYYNPPEGSFPGDPSSYLDPVYIGAGRGETALWEDPYLNANLSLPGGARALAQAGVTVTHNYVLSIILGHLTVTMDGVQIFSGIVSVPPLAYLYFTASTGTFYERVVVSYLTGKDFEPSY